MRYIAVRLCSGGIYIDKEFFERFTDNDLAMYGYTKIVLTDEQFANISVDDFDLVGDENPVIVFNSSKHESRLELIKQNKDKVVYKQLIVSKIRSIYSIDDEIAIIRQKEQKPEEYQEYYNFVEQCKIEAKNELNNKEE